MIDPETDDLPPITQLTPRQRRVLGVLVEKGMTTPEYYPMTLKAIVAGCNQKSNRAPHVNYDEDEVADALEELRALGLAAEVHTESGRTLRYRHYVRRRFTLTEPQLAVLTELLLRGRQQPGELRTRASRMAPIGSLDELREALQGLLDMNLIQASGSLERRGVEVDHNLYTPREGQTLAPLSDDDAGLPGPPPARTQPAASATPVAPAAGPPAPPTAALAADHFRGWDEALDTLRQENRELRDELEQVKDRLRDLSDEMDRLRRDLGG